MVGNAVIAVAKFVGFLFSGSSSLFSEAIHSIADTANEALLFVGLRRSMKKPDAEFSYGYGQERFLWALISACGIFFLGAVVNIYYGASAFVHEPKEASFAIAIVILLVSLVIESFTLWLAWRELRERHPGNFREVIAAGDPVLLAVFYEDSAAVLGVLLALGSIGLTVATGSHAWDALGSIAIGVLLGIIAVILINKNRQFLMAKSISPKMRERIIEILKSEPAIERVIDFKSAMMGDGVSRIKCEVEWNGTALLRDAFRGTSMREEWDEMENYEEFTRFSADFADRLPRLMGEKIDELEHKIRQEFPDVRHIDIEVN
jgi:solute carrier family 30 (zinc transporter), member 9